MAIKRIEKRQNENNLVQAPQPFSDIIDHICKQDKKYFEENPGHSSTSAATFQANFGLLVSLAFSGS